MIVCVIVCVIVYMCYCVYYVCVSVCMFLHVCYCVYKCVCVIVGVFNRINCLLPPSTLPPVCFPIRVSCKMGHPVDIFLMLVVPVVSSWRELIEFLVGMGSVVARKFGKSLVKPTAGHSSVPMMPPHRWADSYEGFVARLWVSQGPFPSITAVGVQAREGGSLETHGEENRKGNFLSS